MNEHLLREDQQKIRVLNENAEDKLRQLMTKRDAIQTSYVITLAEDLLAIIQKTKPPDELNVSSTQVSGDTLPQQLAQLNLRDKARTNLARPIEYITPYYKQTQLEESILNLQNIHILDEEIYQLTAEDQNFSIALQTCNDPMFSVLYLVKNKAQKDTLSCSDWSSINLLRNSISNDKWYYKRNEMDYYLLTTDTFSIFSAREDARTQVAPNTIYVSLKTAQELINTYTRHKAAHGDKISLLALEYDKTIDALPPPLFRGAGNIDINVYNFVK